MAVVPNLQGPDIEIIVNIWPIRALSAEFSNRLVAMEQVAALAICRP
jgi:hypothetical protein